MNDRNPQGVPPMARSIEFTPGQPLLPCPFCGWVADGLTEAELYRHLVAQHEERIEQATEEVRTLREAAGR